MKTLKTLLAAAIIACAIGTAAQAGTITVSGTVTDSSKNPLNSVIVTNIDTKATATTGRTGAYSIAATVGDRLQFSCTGFDNKIEKVKGTTLNVVLNYIPTISVVECEVTDCIVMEDCKQAESPTRMVMRDETRMMKAMTAPAMNYAVADMSGYYPGGEEYSRVKENRFVNVAKDPLSTFALEVDGASYSNARRMINQGSLPQKDAIRVEEFINYFSYDYAKPTGGDPLKVNYEVGPCPWNDSHKLVRIGVKAREIPSDNLPKANFVFLIDVSGSMYGANRLSLVVSSLKLLVNNLRPEDRVAIVTYAGSTRVALESTSGSDKQKIRETLDGLIAGGSTAGAAGITLAYEIAAKNFIKGGNNRVILATDGDFNVGVSSNEGLEDLITQQRKSGIFLTALGYGMGNYKDEKMQTLAEKGNGNYAYIDNMQEANKVLVNEFGGTMYTVAKDVKLQVEFNPARVSAFRLVGYESRLLEHEDFNDDTKDAGEIGAGHTVTALYEIVLVGSDSTTGSIDPLKYQPSPATIPGNYSAELMTVKIRYKQPDGDVSSKIEVPVKETKNALSEDFHFVSAVAMLAQLMRDSDFKGDATYAKVIEEARRGLGSDANGYRHEFVRLAETAKSISGEN